MDAPRFTGFEILETMPQGAMGTVYKARQISLDRIVALKMLPPDLAADSADLDRFLTEAKLTASLKHPNIVQVYDFGKSEEGIYYFVMEFVSGYSVGEWIRRKRLLSEENSLLVAQSVAGALGYAWEKDRVIHCDIKPDNIMIDWDGTVKVADLGLAKSVRSIVDRAKTATGIVFGTPNYISPEQSRGDVELDFRTDVYSLGAMLYHGMTGRMPFEGEPHLKVMDRQITDQVPDPQDVNPNISTESACLIEKMMAKNREERQQDWKSVSEDILRVMSRQMPAGELPGVGKSTIRRSAERGKRPHVVVKAAPKARSKASTVYADSTAFEEMERKFERKQKRVGPRPEWWFAGAIGVAALVLGLLVLRSVSTRRGAWRATRSETHAEARTAVPQISTTNVEQMKSGSEKQGQKKDAGEMFDFAMKWAEANPTKYDEAVGNFEKVATETKGTKYSLMAVAEVQRIRYVKAKAVNDVLDTLAEQADAMARDKNFLGAAELYEQYQGDFINETMGARGLRAQVWRDTEKAFREEQSMADERWQTLIQDVSAALVSGDQQAALARVRLAAKDGVLATRESELNGLETVLLEVARMEQRILDSFRAQTNREVTLTLAKGPEKLTIRNVQGDRIEAEKVVVVGAGHVSQPRMLRVPDLAPAEKRLRLGSADAPEVALMNGLLLVQEGDLESAEPFFASAGPLLSAPLVAELNKMKGLSAEEEARRAFARLMRSVQIDVPAEIPARDVCLSAVRGKTFSEKDAQALAKAVETYRSKYGGTEFAREYEPVLDRLATVVPREGRQAEPVEPAQSPREKPLWADAEPVDPGAVRALLLKRNPGLSDENVLFNADRSGRIVGATLWSPVLRDIQPLASLRDLREVICSAHRPWEREDRSPMLARLSDISPLKGLALRELRLCHTQVKSLAPLVGMPLKKLNLSHTKVQDLQCLAGLPLTDLDISRSVVNDIRFLEGIPLERLNISGTDVDTLLPLRYMRLSVLDASHTKIRSVTSLRGMPLESLDISDTDVPDISVLKGMHFERLAIARTQVRDITPLRGMPLESLDIEGIGLKNLSVLKGMSLHSLKMGDTRISDLSPLEGMPLRSLSIKRNDVKDLSVLQTMPLKHLDLTRTKVKDLTQIQGMQLEGLTIKGTSIRDLSPLRGMPLRFLDLAETEVRDLTPIENSPIEEIWLNYDPFGSDDKSHWQSISVLRKMPNLKVVNGRNVLEQGWQLGRKK